MAKDNDNPYQGEAPKPQDEKADAASSLPEIPSEEAPAKPEMEEPSIKEILCYSTAGVTGGLNNQTLAYMWMPLLNLGLGISPILVGFMLTFKSLWDGITDPIMAQISDNWKGKNGRRRPFILWGGIVMAVGEASMWWIVSRDWDPGAEWYVNKYFWFFAAFRLFLATAQTVHSVPYWAMGIELSPSYHGKTRVFAVRALFQKVAAFIGPWLYPLCLLPFFKDSLQGVRYISVILSFIMIAGVCFTYFGSKERIRVDKSKKKKMNIAKSMAVTFKNRHFVKIVLIYVLLGWGLGIFGVLGMYLNIYYIYGGDKLKGATLGAIIGMEGIALAMIGIPFITWFCKKFQKHNAMRFTLAALIIGKVLGWWCINPTYPWLLAIIPFFFSFGISAFYLVLSTMFADVVDVDELITGQRREGMFGACNAWVIKSSGAMVGALSGIILAATGFNVLLGRAQDPQTIFNMRLALCGISPLVMSIGFLLLRKYPLTEKVLGEVKAELKVRRAKAHKEAEAEELAAMIAEEESMAQEISSMQAEEETMDDSLGE